MSTKARPKLARLVIRKEEPVAPVSPEQTETVTAPEQTVEPVRVSPVHRFVDKLRAKDGIAYRTTAEVAAELGVSVGWIHKVQRSPAIDAPSLVSQLGKIKIYIYTPEDVEKIRRYLAEQQQVFVNGPGDRVQSWEEVSKRRGRSTQDEDREDATGDPEAG